MHILAVLAHWLVEGILVCCLLSLLFFAYVIAGTNFKKWREDRAIFKFVKEARRDFN